MIRQKGSVTVLLLAIFMCFAYSRADAKVFKKAKPAETTTDFVDGSIMSPMADLPFNKAWKSSQLDKNKFSEIYVAPINTEYLRQNSWWNELNIKDVEDNIDEIAATMRSKIRRTFWEASNNRFKIVNKPGPNTMILEIAITEIIPNKAGFELLLTAAGPATGAVAASVGSAVTRKIGAQSSISIEGRFRDGGDGSIVGMFADREQEKGTIINLRNFTWYGQIDLIIEEWAQQLVKIANRTPNEVIADTPTFSLKPW